MKGIILIEGPDGSGKSSLAKRIINDNGYGKYLHADYKFKNNIPLYHLALLKKAIKLSKKTLVIIDRLHISEYIYAKVFRGGTKWPKQLNEFNKICKHLNIPIIICVPNSVERGIEWFNENKDTRKELYKDNLEKVIEEYIKYTKNHNEVITYNRDYNDIYYDWYYKDTFDILERLLNE